MTRTSDLQVDADARAAGVIENVVQIARQGIRSQPALDRVADARRHDRVIAGAAKQHIARARAKNGIIAGAAVERIRVGKADQRIVQTRADDRFEIAQVLQADGGAAISREQGRPDQAGTLRNQSHGARLASKRKPVDAIAAVHRVIAVAGHECVRARAAQHAVRTAAARETVVAGIADKRVAGRIAKGPQRVIPRAAGDIFDVEDRVDLVFTDFDRHRHARHEGDADRLAAGRVGNHIRKAVAAVEPVVAQAANQHIGTSAAAQCIVSQAARQAIVASFAHDGMSDRVTGSRHRVIAGAGDEIFEIDDRVDFATGDDNAGDIGRYKIDTDRKHLTRIGHEVAVTSTAIDRVVAKVGRNRIIAGGAGQDVRLRIARDPVVEIRAENIGKARQRVGFARSHIRRIGARRHGHVERSGRGRVIDRVAGVATAHLAVVPAAAR